MNFINIGFGNMVSAGRVVAIASPDSAPIKRLVQDAKEQGLAIDATCGRKCKSVIISDSKHVIMSSLDVNEISDIKEKNISE